MKGTLAIRFSIVALLVVPSALYLWPQSDVPAFCDLHDDCIYFVSAKSLADGGGYRIASLPGEPAQTKYPPLYPLLLSAAWRINPDFPQNLTPAVWISWLALPGMLLALASLYPRYGFSGWRCWVLLTLIAINPFTITFSAKLLSELLFIALLASALILVERASQATERVGIAAAAGIVMGLAYLARSAGIVALGTVPLFFLLRKQPRKAVAFAAAMLPFVAAWMAWARFQQIPTADPNLMYYVDYAGYQVYNVSFSELPTLLWKNIDGLLSSLGSLVFPKVFDSLLMKILTQMIAVWMISGIVRMVRRGQALAYALFALGSALLLIVWHFPPNERFIFPIFPLAVAGLLVEIEHLAEMVKAGLRHRKRDQRIASVFVGAAAGIILAAGLALQIYVSQVYMPEDASLSRAKRDSQAPAYQWVEQQTPESAVILTMRDPLFYLQTGRHAVSRRIPPMYWYRDDREAIIDSFRTLAPFARTHGSDYVYYFGVDFGWSIDEEDENKIDQSIRSNPELVAEFHDGKALVYRVTAASTAKASGNGVDQTAGQHNQ